MPRQRARGRWEAHPYPDAMAKTRNKAELKAAKAEAKATRKAASKQRRSQLWQAFQMQRKEDKRLLPYMIGAFVLIVAAAVVAGVFVGGFTMFMLIPLGVVLGALVAFIIFGRRAQKSVYHKAEGQAGAAAWALENLRGKWRVTPGVAATGHLRRRAPGDRQAGRDLRRRRIGRTRETASGAREEAHRAARRRHARSTTS